LMSHVTNIYVNRMKYKWNPVLENAANAYLLL